MPTTSIAWRPAAAYLYVLHLDGPSLAWEYLRRNPGYRHAWQHHCRRPAASRPYHWGLRLFEDPARDARCVQPHWIPDPDHLILLHPDHDPPVHAPLFQLWRIPGRKQLHHDGKRLLLASQCEGLVLRMAIAQTLEDGMAYAYGVRPGPQLRVHWRVIEPRLLVLETADGRRRPLSARRPDRLLLAHMRSLQALDGVLAGASQREVAQAIFGADEVARRWHPDSELRAQVRHLIRRGRAFMTGGYRRLLHSHLRGDQPFPAESP